ncbi:S66 peptidase family protein [Promicromonospora thailandica]|uniref:Muramoyltetrapeptide carboxypeptidase LdcA (Peptidoglycan recycling) n=1 Tax=Promicromonospora thailandica TaxID=765201 RepID=A0A9X2G0W5_9MICO|nr:S66 peptidase family protein [Promicromonospora thailandica]MCP2263202.1 Muramoyltetrapeptide carboxypeptidase LdcA (peptidoglycan recycling) [Promicromonospora thailandica]BFF18590.1 LD-carboxypeptidase [Promicromonospora thailandica]
MSAQPETVLPPKLRAGDTLRVVAPARSRAMIMEHDNTRWIDERFAAMGLALTFGEHVDEDDQFRSGSIEHRVADLHAAFADPSVAGILTVIGGYNSNELLPYLDFDLIAAHPKVFCGYSDISALQNAILARTGLVTYSGPHWSSWGMRDHFEPTGDWFRAAVMDDAPIAVQPAAEWTDDLWFADQDARTPVPNEGWWPLRPGRASGRVVGGNLATLSLLQGTPYMPSLEGALLFLEDDFESDATHVARRLTSLLQLPGADGVTGLVVGRFQASSGITRAALDEIVARQPALRGKPVLAGVDLGHTSPLLTVPIGGTATLAVESDAANLTITRH